jgi:hypothetical protein
MRLHAHESPVIEQDLVGDGTLVVERQGLVTYLSRALPHDFSEVSP